MDFKELLLLALEALKRNLARTLLTMLGIIIGIGSVITVISLGEGTTASIVDQISSFGANVITVQPGKSRRGPGSGGVSSTVTTLAEEDMEVIKKLPHVIGVSGVINKNKTITVDGESESASIRGVEESYDEIQSLTIEQGLFFDEAQARAASRVTVLGDEVVEELFGEEAEVVGETVRIDAKTFRIIGVIDGSSEALIPLKTAQKILFGQDHLDSISVAVESSEQVEQLMEEIEDALMLEHEIEKDEEVDFSLRSAQEMISTVSEVTGTMTAMLSGIAAISLLVGGIGIMNIMLVTVTERTKEIGLLKAIGAKSKDILTQFLIEAVVLTLFGGAIGMLVGVGITYIISGMINVPFVVSLSSVLLAIGVSGGVGILFGWYPASRAAKLHPIDALRYE
jgi:putative ABC transport system permease protein